MSARTELLMDELATAVELHLAGDRRAAVDHLLNTAEDQAEVCGFVTGLAAGVAAAVEGEGTYQAVTFPLPGAVPSAEDDEVAGVLAAVIAAVGNGDMDGAVHAWLAATIRVQIFTLIALLDVFCSGLKDRTP